MKKIGDISKENIQTIIDKKLFKFQFNVPKIENPAKDIHDLLIKMNEHNLNATKEFQKRMGLFEIEIKSNAEKLNIQYDNDKNVFENIEIMFAKLKYNKESYEDSDDAFNRIIDYLKYEVERKENEDERFKNIVTELSETKTKLFESEKREKRNKIWFWIANILSVYTVFTIIKTTINYNFDTIVLIIFVAIFSPIIAYCIKHALWNK